MLHEYRHNVNTDTIFLVSMQHGMQLRPIDASVRRSSMNFDQGYKKDMVFLNVTTLNIAECTKRIHISDPNIWDEGFVVVVLVLSEYWNLEGR